MFGVVYLYTGQKPSRAYGPAGLNQPEPQASNPKTCIIQ